MSSLPPEPLPAAAKRGDAYCFEQQLGRGANGAVWRASRRDDEEQVGLCIKVVYNVQAGLQTNELSRRYETEFRLLEDQTRLPVQENIIRVFDHFNDDPVRLGLPDWREMKKGHEGRFARTSVSGPSTDNNLFIVMELMDADLHKLTNVRRAERKVCPFFTDVELFVIIEQVSCALCHLKEHNIVHRDIKPDNILIKGELENCNSGQVKLGDFGEHWDAFAFAETVGSGFVMKNSGQTFGGRGAGGALYALAPEVRLALQDRTDVDYLQNDIWALGHSVWNVAYPGDSSPFPGSHRDLMLFCASNYHDLPDSYGESLRLLLRGILDPDPNKRLSCTDAMLRAKEGTAPASAVGATAREAPRYESEGGTKMHSAQHNEELAILVDGLAISSKSLDGHVEGPSSDQGDTGGAGAAGSAAATKGAGAAAGQQLAAPNRELALRPITPAVRLESSSTSAWGIARRAGDSISAAQLSEGNIQHIYSTYTAFAALMESGRVVTWGAPESGGDSSKVQLQLTNGVKEIFSTFTAFAALKSNGSVVTWGGRSRGGDSSAVQRQLASGVRQVFATSAAFAALKLSGEVVTWGDEGYGSDSRAVQAQLRSGVSCVFSTASAFAALKDDGSVVTWTSTSPGGDSHAVKDQLSSGVQHIFPSASAFAALKSNGSVVSWGVNQFGGDSSEVQAQLQGDVQHIFANYTSFAALKVDGSVVTWGAASRGGDSRAVQDQLVGGVAHVCSTDTAFAALRVDGSVITWGAHLHGGDSSAVEEELACDVQAIFSTCRAFAAVKTDGSVVTWGDPGRGGDSSTVWEHLQCDVVHVYSTETAFAALKVDGSVVTWGLEQHGGDSSSVWGQLDSDVVRIYSTDAAFAALKADGTVITWGSPERGGDSSSVQAQLTRGIAQMSSAADTVDALIKRVSESSIHT